MLQHEFRFTFLFLFEDRCPFCGGKVVFDHWLDLNLCTKCGARECEKGLTQGQQG